MRDLLNHGPGGLSADCSCRATCDTDGNFLQAVDDVQMEEILPKISELVRDVKTLKILDLGCGTGRTTTKLAQHSWPCEQIKIEGWGASAAMLNTAKTNLSSLASSHTAVNLHQIDLQNPTTLPHDSKVSFDIIIISTLALDHSPLATFFQLISTLLKSGGVAFVSNLHPDMGARSVAGYDDMRGARRIGRNLSHGIEESLDAAKRAGLEVKEVKEVELEERGIEEGLVVERGRKWVGMKLWMGLMVRKM